MTNRTAVLTTIFPMKEAFLCECLNSLENQSFKHFDVVVVNDGYQNFSKVSSKYKNLKIIELLHSDSPSKNREYGINFIKNKDYDVVILADSDDYVESNRVEVSLKYLNDYDVVVNDLSLFNADSVYSDNYLSNRFVNEKNLKINDIKDKNFFGFSNTAFKSSVIKNVSFDAELIAVDWYFFSCLLLEGYKSVFTNETKTYYRQYQGNTVGLGELTKKLLKRGLKIKQKHYELMVLKDESYGVLLNQVKNLRESINTDADVEAYITATSECQPEYPLWWENIKLPGN